MARSRGRVVLLLLLTFAAGTAAGIAADRLRWIPGEATAGEAPPEDAEPREAERDRDRDDRGRGKGNTTIERFADELGLTPQQRSEIEEILEDHRSRVKQMWAEIRPRYRALMDTARTRIEAVLTPEQVEQYRALLERRYGNDDDERRRDGQDDRGPDG